jgi:hypothetical protein
MMFFLKDSLSSKYESGTISFGILDLQNIKRMLILTIIKKSKKKELRSVITFEVLPNRSPRLTKIKGNISISQCFLKKKKNEVSQQKFVMKLTQIPSLQTSETCNLQKLKETLVTFFKKN